MGICQNRTLFSVQFFHRMTATFYYPISLKNTSYSIEDLQKKTELNQIGD